MAWFAMPSPKLQLEPKSLLALATVMLCNAASMNSCWTAKANGEPGAVCCRIEKEEDTTAGSCAPSQNAAWKAVKTLEWAASGKPEPATRPIVLPGLAAVT